jgi:hypothetical protein
MAAQDVIRLTFEGTCLFVPDPGDAMHVLMPAVGDLAPHETILSFPAICLFSSPPKDFPESLFVHLPVTGCDIVIGSG